MPKEQGLCVECGIRKQKKKPPTKGEGFLTRCWRCYREKYAAETWRGHQATNRKWRKYVGVKCERCGFVPEHICQLDVDHIDGSKADSGPGNLQTLCANCHRLKTFKERGRGS